MLTLAGECGIVAARGFWPESGPPRGPPRHPPTGERRRQLLDYPHVAVLGCGGWGKNLVRSLHELGRLRAVVDPTAAGRERARKLAPGVPVHDTADALWRDPQTRGVMIATPAETHYRLARAAIEAGKDVLVEKPMTVDLDDARDLVVRARDADRVLMVGHVLYTWAAWRVCVATAIPLPLLRFLKCR